MPRKTDSYTKCYRIHEIDQDSDPIYLQSSKYGTSVLICQKSSEGAELQYKIPYQLIEILAKDMRDAASESGDLDESSSI